MGAEGRVVGAEAGGEGLLLLCPQRCAGGVRP